MLYSHFGIIYAAHYKKIKVLPIELKNFHESFNEKNHFMKNMYGHYILNNDKYICAFIHRQYIIDVCVFTWIFLSIIVLTWKHVKIYVVLLT